MVSSAKQQFSRHSIMLFACLFSAFLFTMYALPVDAAIVPDCNPVPGSDKSCGVDDIFQLLVNVYNFLLGMAAIVAMIAIIISGVLMLTYHYFENPDQVLQGAKLTLTRAVFGLAIVIMAYLIVNTLLLALGVNAGGKLGQLLIRWGLLQ
jgi:hypothetical protein